MRDPKRTAPEFPHKEMPLLLMLARCSNPLLQRADKEADAKDAPLRIDNAALEPPPQRDNKGKANGAVITDRNNALEREQRIINVMLTLLNCIGRTRAGSTVQFHESRFPPCHL